MVSVRRNRLYLCIEDVVMDWSNIVAYTKGKIYKSESSGNITDNNGHRSHQISDEFATIHFVDVEEIFESHIKNRPMIRSLKKLGLTFEQILKQYTEYKLNHIEISEDKIDKINILFENIE